jgi:hypothetical protein
LNSASVDSNVGSPNPLRTPSDKDELKELAIAIKGPETPSLTTIPLLKLEILGLIIHR